MRLDEEQEWIIENFVMDNNTDIRKLKSYLCSHDKIGVDVFEYCQKKKVVHFFSGTGRMVPAGFEHGYTEEIGRDAFIRRIPFYFYQPGRSEKDFGRSRGMLTYYRMDWGDGYFEDAEELYNGLEFIFYTVGLSQEQIFEYPIQQVRNPDADMRHPLDRALASAMETGNLDAGAVLFRWVDYLRICMEQCRSDYMPERFITAYNHALELDGREPVMYCTTHDIYDSHCLRQGRAYVFDGNFPCDDDGAPIMEWIGIRVKNAKSIKFTAAKSRHGDLVIEITPTTVIYAVRGEKFDQLERDKDGKIDWYPVYSGPRNMCFDHTALKSFRTGQHMTQAEVAEAVGTSVRTYQKWERGDTTPDGQNLLRIMNWLDIGDVQDLVKFDGWEEICNGEEGQAEAD